MTTLTLTVKGDGLKRFEAAVETLGEAKARTAFRRAINQAGRDTKTATGRALAKQTGLKLNVTRRALKEDKATPAFLQYVLKGRGGEISLKHFAPRETRTGVSAAPFGQREVFAHTFMKAGWFGSGRVIKPNWNGQVFMRLSRKTSTGKSVFEKQKSGVFIPVEMVRGVTAETFQTVGTTKLEQNVQRHIQLVTKGVLT